MVCHAAGEGLTHWRQRITYQTGCEECCSSVPLVTTVRAHLPASLPIRHHVLKTTVGRVLQLPLPVAWSYMAVNHFAHEAVMLVSPMSGLEASGWTGIRTSLKWRCLCRAADAAAAGGVEHLPCSHLAVQGSPGSRAVCPVDAEGAGQNF